uniref:Uncharacterized protein n=1 Tax=Anguilla anguilla TaxID=7936 RepID=A0A0E9VAZ8_ANGAN
MDVLSPLYFKTSSLATDRT